MNDKIMYLKNIRQLDAYIEKNLYSRIKLSDAARHCAMSERHLWRVFNELFGESLSAYIRRRRLTAAADALKNNRYSIEKVCAMTGFESEEAFYRAFKRQFGVTPSDYRDKGGMYYTRKRNRLNPGYIIHMLNSGISLKPLIEIKSAIKLNGMNMIIRRKQSVYDSAAYFLKFITINFLKKCEGTERYFLKAQGADGKKLFGSQDRVEVFAGREKPCPLGFKGKTIIKKGRYAVFKHTGPVNTMGYSCEYIFTRWFARRKPPACVYVMLTSASIFKNDFTAEFWCPL